MIKTSARAGTASVSQEAPYVSVPISEITAGARRLEAEGFLSDGYAVRRDIQQSRLKTRTLGQIARIWQPSRLKGIQVEFPHGVPFLAATQVFDIWPTPRKWLSASKTPHLQRRYVEPGWILVTCSGTVGNSIMTYSAHSDLVISHDLLRVEVDEIEIRSYVYGFLRTPLGRSMMRASHYGNVIKHLEVAHLTELPIPILDHLIDETHEQVTAVLKARDEAYRLDNAARSQFAKAMKNQPDLASEEGYTVPASRLFSGRRRMEANAHSPRSRFVVQVYEQNASATTTLGTLAQVILPGRFKRIYGDTGVSYLHGEQLFSINPELTKLLTPATNINFNNYLVQPGWLLMACSRQTYGINGQAILASEWHADKVVTADIIRLIPNLKMVRSGYLQTVLSHPSLGKPLVVSHAYGTSIPHLAAEDVERLPIPRLACEVEDEIADAAEQASDLRMRADEWENAAVAKLEGELAQKLGLTLDNRRRGPLRFSQVA